MTTPDEQHADAARRGFGEMVRDRLPHLPPPAAVAIADALFAAAGQRRWDAWPERVELDGETIELPAGLSPLVQDIRAEVDARLRAGETGAADVPALRTLVARLSNFPPPSGGAPPGA